jgi:hypothetical protein
LKGKAALLTEDLRRLAARAPENLLGLRDRALSLIGFAGAFRRSELAAIDFADLDFRSVGVVVTLPKSKTDQEQAGRPVAIPKGADPETCPVRALQSWLFAAGIVSGPVARSEACEKFWVVSDWKVLATAPARLRSMAGFLVADLAPTMLLCFEAKAQNRLGGISDGILISPLSKLFILHMYWLLR